MSDRSDSDERARVMRRRAADWAKGAAASREFERRRAAALTVNERLAEGIELTRIADRLKVGANRSS